LQNAVELRFHEKYIPEPNTGCWLWIAAQYYNRYGVFRFNGKNTGAHRVSYEIHYGPFDKSLFVCHKCDIKECVNPDHLFLGTHKENMKDCINKGRFKTGRTDGTFNPNVSLSEKDVLNIRREFCKKKRNGRILAKKYGVSPQNICSIVKRKLWKHI
jgi:hypothetical protein